MFVIDSYLRNGDTEEERTAGDGERHRAGAQGGGRSGVCVSSEWDGRRGESRNARTAHDDGGRTRSFAKSSLQT